MSELRKLGKGTPIVWMDRRCLDLIAERCPKPSSAILVYMALCYIAEKAQSQIFKASHSEISKVAQVSRSTTQRRLLELSEAEFITIKTPLMKAACTYSLPPFAMRHGDATLRHKTPQSGVTVTHYYNNNGKDPKRNTLGAFPLDGNSLSDEEVELYKLAAEGRESA